METFSLLDPDKTVIGDSYSVLNMAFRDVLEVRPPAMFRDENHRYLTFVSSDLREQMESQGITGCLFRTLDEYIQDS